MKKSLTFLYILVVCSLLAFAFPQHAAAQDDDDPPGRVGRLNYVQGSVSFRPAGEEEWVGVVPNRPITTGDMIWADANSRAEVRIGSATIRMNSSTGFSFLNLDDRIVQIQLSEGTLSVHVRRLEQDEIYEVDTPNQAFSIQRAGLYRFEADPDGNSTSVTVRAGEGEATGGGQIFAVHSGQTATFTGTDSLYADVVNAGDADEFDNWSEARSRRFEESRSARYVSPDVVGYEDLDDNGEWSADPGYGNVWFPRVNAGWAPYHDGHWVWISPWGWTWVDDAPWGYAPFHYGRWVALRGRWAWVPGPIAVRAVYAPALVAFIGGSGFGVSISVGGGGGNVGWFPLGPREVYVPSYHVSERYVNRVNVSNTVVSNTVITNVYNTQVTNINTTNVTNVTNITYVNKTVPGAVTAVPQRTFTSAQPVARAAVTMSAQQVAAAPVNVRTVAVPTRNSVLGASAPATANRVAQPPAAIASRPVVAKVAPPPPPVSFARQQQALEAHPGQPLARNELQNLRPAPNTPAAQPQVRQAPPGKQATPNMNRPFNQQQGQGAKPGQPAASQPAIAQPVPQPNAQPAPRPNTAQPNTQPTPQPAPPVRENRPPAAQPNPQPAPRPNANQPNAQPAQRPDSQPDTVPNPRPAPPAQPNHPPAQQPNAQPTQRSNDQPNQRPIPPARDNRPSEAQPNPQPAQRPTPPAQQVRPEPMPQPAPPAQQNHPPAQQPKPQPAPQTAPAPSHPNRPPAQEPKAKPDAKPKDKDKDKPTRPDDKPPEPHSLTQMQ